MATLSRRCMPSGEVGEVGVREVRKVCSGIALVAEAGEHHVGVSPTR